MVKPHVLYGSGERKSIYLLLKNIIVTKWTNMNCVRSLWRDVMFSLMLCYSKHDALLFKARCFHDHTDNCRFLLVLRKTVCFDVSLQMYDSCIFVVFPGKRCEGTQRMTVFNSIKT